MMAAFALLSGESLDSIRHTPDDAPCLRSRGSEFRKSTGTLVLRDLKPGKRLYLLSTGTGVAPFMSVFNDPETYERFRHVVLVHGVRWSKETAVVKHFIDDLEP